MKCELNYLLLLLLCHSPECWILGEMYLCVEEGMTLTGIGKNSDWFGEEGLNMDTLQK